MCYDPNEPVKSAVTSIIEFGVGAILKWILFIILIGSVILVVAGDAKTSSESLVILLVLGFGFVFGVISLAISLFR